MEASYYDDNGWHSANAMDYQKYRDFLASLPNNGRGYVSEEQKRVAAAFEAAHPGWLRSFWDSLTSGVSSAYETFVDWVKTQPQKDAQAIQQVIDEVLSASGDTYPSGKSVDTVSGATSSSDPSLLPVTYEGAPYAQLYGMDNVTAYEEALANSAVQRRVKDLQAAGLNPVLAASDGASGVSGASVYAPDSPMPTSAKSQSSAITAFGNVIGGIFELLGKRSLATGIKSIAKGLDNLF